MFDKIKQFLTLSSSTVPTLGSVSPDVGTRAGERREIKIQGASYGFCYCPPGVFLMGSPKSEAGRSNAEFQHKVTLTRGFWILETPVTQGLWTSVMNNNPSCFCSTGYGVSCVKGTDTTDFPVEEVSWNDCQNFLKHLNDLSGRSFKLPAEAQWEYACRAGTQTAYYWGDVWDARQANNNWGRTCAVKSFGANPWGLYDCYGNVWEWLSDWYGAYPRRAVVDPGGAKNGLYRVIRGGFWDVDARFCRSAYRGRHDPANGNGGLGFRFLFEESIKG